MSWRLFYCSSKMSRLCSLHSLTKPSSPLIKYTWDQNVFPGWPVYRVKCLCSWEQEWGREGCHSHHLFKKFIHIMTWSAFDSNLVMISSLASKWKVVKVSMHIFQLFYEMKLKTSKFKILAFWGQWRYHNAIQIASSSCHKNQTLKSWWEWQPSLSYSNPLEHRHFTS